MLDRDTFTRDARGCILDWPVTIRHNQRVIQAGCQSVEDSDLLMPGGLVDDFTLTLLAIASDFGSTPPTPRDLIEIQQRNGKWLEAEVKHAPDRYDPLTPTFTFVVGSPEK